MAVAVIIVLLVVIAYFLFQQSPNKQMKDDLRGMDTDRKADSQRVASYKKKVADAEKEKGAPLTKEEKEKIAKVVDYEIVKVGVFGIIVSSAFSKWRFEIDDEDVKYPENAPSNSYINEDIDFDDD